MTTTHPIDDLFARLHHLAPYPDGVAPVRQRIDGTSFFPGGHGLWRPDPDAPLGPPPRNGILILGNNWGTVGDHAVAVAERSERLTDPTFKGLLAILAAAGVSPAQCFFTNAYMGLLDSDSNLDEFPTESAFGHRCEEFLREQLAMLRPRAILTLGGNAVHAIAALSPDLRRWRGPRGGRRQLGDLDAEGLSLIRARFDGIQAPVAVVWLHHPSMPNGASRVYRTQSGTAAEAALVRDAV